MSEAENYPKPEFDFSAHEIDLVNNGQVRLLEQEWLNKHARGIDLTPQYLDANQSERLGVAGSSHNTILDFDHADEPRSWAFTAANDYAYGLKTRVDKMYEEAYAANSHSSGPEAFFEEQLAQAQQSHRFRTRVAGFFGKISLKS